MTPIPSNLDTHTKAYLEELSANIRVLREQVVALQRKVLELENKLKSKQTLIKN
jgi:prefoldin subunit 5